MVGSRCECLGFKHNEKPQGVGLRFSPFSFVQGTNFVLEKSDGNVKQKLDKDGKIRHSKEDATNKTI